MKHENEKYDDRIVDVDEIIPEDEPVFLIRGQDILGGDVVRHYAILLETISRQHHIDNTKKVHSIREHARRMDNWSKHKIPD